MRWQAERGRDFDFLRRSSMAIKPMRMALLLNGRDKGYARPKYGLVDDEILLRKGVATFLATDGQHLEAQRDDLVLLGDVEQARA
jgi:hypothetical protein